MIRILNTIYIVDKENKYLALIAAKSEPQVDNLNLPKALCSGKNMEIRFHYQGSKNI
jgi:hypothetical protein